MKREQYLKRADIQQKIAQYKIDMEMVQNFTEKAAPRYRIDQELYEKYDVKRGLRDLDGNGVRAGLTTISKVSSLRVIDGVPTRVPGILEYRGIPIETLVNGFFSGGRLGFEEVAYLLIMGKLPNKAELARFNGLLRDYRPLPPRFNNNVIMKMPSDNIMNTMGKCVLALHAYDPRPDNTSISNVMRQCLQLVAQFPTLAIFGYQASMYFRYDKSMYIRDPRTDLSTAENILYMMRPDGKFTSLEAQMLDLCLVLHAEHGGGNNSAFMVHVASSTGTDTYATMSAALGSLKGPKHGSAILKVADMFDDLKANCPDWGDEAAIERYLLSLLRGEGFDRSGRIYGMGHAVYAITDPRAVLLRTYVERLAMEKGAHEEFLLYQRVERIAARVIRENRRIYKGVCANVDFYAGFVYRLLDLPRELYTPMFAVGRIAGWSAHRIEELINCKQVIRPAYLAVGEEQDYEPLEERE